MGFQSETQFRRKSKSFQSTSSCPRIRSEIWNRLRRNILVFAIQNNMVVHQMDVVTAFLNGKLDENIYMRQPEGYVQPGKEHLVCKLQKSLYGLK